MGEWVVMMGRGRLLKGVLGAAQGSHKTCLHWSRAQCGGGGHGERQGHPQP